MAGPVHGQGMEEGYRTPIGPLNNPYTRAKEAI